jgi:Domain of unknown function (DUF4288)
MERVNPAVVGDKWFLAEIVLKVTNRSESTCRVHVNFVLVEATSAEEAYARAVELGRMENNTFENRVGELIDVEFKGLKNLHRIYERILSHGAELLYEELASCTEEDFAALVRPKHQMNAFEQPEGRPKAADSSTGKEP